MSDLISNVILGVLSLRESEDLSPSFELFSIVARNFRWFSCQTFGKENKMCLFSHPPHVIMDMSLEQNFMKASSHRCSCFLCSSYHQKYHAEFP